MKYAVEMSSDAVTCIPSFMIIDSAIQVILLPQNFKGCSVGITDGSDS
jgi:hypothetical protein